MLKVYFKLKEQYLKTAMEYTANFWIMIFSGVLMRGLMMGAAFIIFRNVPTIAGWKEGEVYLIMSFMFLSEGLCNLFFDGIWHLASLVFTGKLDVMLVRPVSTFFQVLSYEVALQGFGVTALGVVGIILSIRELGWIQPITILLCILFAVTGMLFRLSTYIISASSVFWLGPTPADPMYMIYSFGENARYPIDVYPSWMRIVLLAIIPFGFIGYFPVQILRGNFSFYWIGILVVFALCFFLLGRKIFNIGIRKYESMGM